MTAFTCRSCGSSRGHLVLDLGVQPLANNLLRPEHLAGEEPKFPLRVAVCGDCWLLQITDIVPPVTLFNEYVYFSSVSEALLLHARSAAERYLSEFELSASSLVVEAASNDGYLLKNFVAARVPCLGVEPAKNIAEVALSRGVPTLNQFFNSGTAARIVSERGQADLVLGNNVFAHAPDTNDFVSGLALLVKRRGRVVLEFPYACDLIEHLEFDTIYHEHVFYFTLTALEPLFARHGLEIFDVERLQIHGGSLRLFAGPRGAHRVRQAVSQLRNEEVAKGITGLGYYEMFAERVKALRESLLRLLRELRDQGHRLCAYGASAKGSTLLNYYGIGRNGFDCLDFVVDRSPAKQGRLTPGTHLPILSVEELLARRPRHALLLTWNFAEEILRQQQAWRDLGGKFILPLPEVKIV
ncbi:MAG TPA: class I SAM-dependent methyltransferase [Verrucomicrobiota bacterium]|nr:methyltransferase [Verrucomicrobiales bacterium]HRI12748.1 class I SAM-dependent methyltransferase [Verrucomicrobiota bacterium]